MLKQHQSIPFTSLKVKSCFELLWADLSFCSAVSRMTFFVQQPCLVLYLCMSTGYIAVWCCSRRADLWDSFDCFPSSLPPTNSIHLYPGLCSFCPATLLCLLLFCILIPYSAGYAFCSLCFASLSCLPLI